MCYVYNEPLASIFELKVNELPKLVAKEIRSPADGKLLASSRELLESTRTCLIALEWMQEHVGHMGLPEELAPLKLNIDKVRGALQRAE